MEGYTESALPLHHASHGPPPREISGRNGGFTLVELLIVMTLIGLLSAAVVIAMPDPRGSLVDEAERFAARAKAAQDKAVLSGTGMAIRVTRVGYGFDRREQGAWRPLAAKPFVDTAWGEGAEAATGAGVMRIVFDSTGIVEPARVTLVRGSEHAVVAFDQDGGIDVVR
ncbi:MAG TPA: GspH/FimT family pseudopilin [Allosphingosinicella sp.]